MIIHYLSASRLKTYLQCSEKYYQAYEKKIRSDAVHLRFGTMIHSVFERWFQENKDILEIYEEEWKLHDVVDPQYYKEGIEMVKNFVEDTDKDEHIVTIGLEQAFAINIEDNIILDVSEYYVNAKAFLKTLEEDDKPYIFGFIDRIDYHIVNDILKIVDYKTSRIALSQDEADEDVQLSMYALVARYLFPEYSSTIMELHYVRLRDKVQTTRTDEQLDEFRNWLINMYHIIKNDVSPKPTINRYCGWCDSRQGCVAYQELLKTTPKDLDVQALEFEQLDKELEDVNTFIKILDGRKKEIVTRFKKELKDSDNDPIHVGGAERYVTNNARINYDINTVIALFPDEYEKLLSVNKGDIDKLAKDNPEIMEALNSTATKYYISPTLRRKKSK